MVKKLLYSTFLNVGIMVLLYCGFIAINTKQYILLAGIVPGLALLIYLKVRLLRKIRSINRK
ncbi:DUF6358 family protein [Albibacterium profundi]|uniref:DUF6358 family protein n=1 Tax=Albibacterium profundi TaxID=3134906 RepID=UPI0035CFCDC7